VTNQGEIAEDEWVRFVCPSREEFIQKKIETIINLIREFQPDGISLDFIRHFVFWEKVHPDRKAKTIPNTCFDNTCVSAFQEKLNIEIPDFEGDVMRLSKWIMDTCPDDWVNWKCELITKTVHRIHDAVRQEFPTCLINLHAVPQIWYRQCAMRTCSNVIQAGYIQLWRMFPGVQRSEWSQVFRSGNITCLNDLLLMSSKDR